jgi:hypothetical protein
LRDAPNADVSAIAVRDQREGVCTNAAKTEAIHLSEPGGDAPARRLLKPPRLRIEAPERNAVIGAVAGGDNRAYALGPRKALADIDIVGPSAGRFLNDGAG